MAMRSTIRSHLHKWVHSWSTTPLIFSWWFSPVALHHLDCNWYDIVWAIASVSLSLDQVQGLWWQQEQWGLKQDCCSGWRVFGTGELTESFFPCQGRRFPSCKAFLCVSFLPVSYCVITSSREAFIKKLEPLAEARRPPLFCTKLDTSAKPSSSCIHVRKSKSSISLECLQCMYITQQQSVC